MAQNSTGEVFGFVDVRRVSKAGTSASTVATPANYTSVSAMRTRLAAINGAYYTAARLDQMSANDMVWAIRQADDAAGIK